MKRLPLFLLFIFLISCFFSVNGQTPDFSKKFSGDTVRHTITQLTNELQLKHPGFYRYNSKKEFDLFIDSVKSGLSDSLNILESFLILKNIISKIHCLHTDISIPADYKAWLNSQQNLLPLQLYFKNGKAHIVKNYSNNQTIAPGAEILSINGKKMSVIVDQLLPLIPADGFNQTMKYRALYYQFPLWYRYLDLADSFNLVIRSGDIEKRISIPAVRFDEIAEEGFLLEKIYNKPLEFNIENNIAILTIHTFSKSAIKKENQDFKKFIDQAFKEIRSKKIQDLIVDLRDNTGGSDANAAYFTRHFFEEPFLYWDRIELTESVAKEIKGVALKLFYRKPVQKDSVWLWQKGRIVRDFDFFEEQKPAKRNFSGKTYVLINGFCMSSCADVAAILSDNKKALLIGQETGGAFQGNNSGIMPETKVEPYGFNLTVPLLKYFNAVDISTNRNNGALPDIPIKASVDDIINGYDREMQLTMKLVLTMKLIMEKVRGTNPLRK